MENLNNFLPKKNQNKKLYQKENLQKEWFTLIKLKQYKNLSTCRILLKILKKPGEEF